VDSCNFSNKANSPTPKVEIHTRQKLCHFGRCVAKAKLFRLKSGVPVTRAGVFIWENFHPGYRDLGPKTQDLGNRASLASHMNTSKFLRRKEKWGEISETEPARLTAFMKRLLVYVVQGFQWFLAQEGSLEKQVGSFLEGRRSGGMLPWEILKF